MAELIFGCDPESQLTPEKVRDAIVECFYKAHCAYSGIIMQSDEKIGHNYCKSIVVKAFKDGGGDFDKPNKSTIIKAMKNLAEFSRNFRDQQMISDNYNKVMTLVDKL